MYRKNFNWMKEQVSTTVPPVHTNTFLKKKMDFRAFYGKMNL
jgi:hypothetical protein